MISQQKKTGWIGAILQAAQTGNVQLPPFSDQGMGGAICRYPGADRFISFKHCLVPKDNPNAGVEWALWNEENGQPTFIATYFEPLNPTPGQVDFILSIFQGWLNDQWTVETAQNTAAQHLNASMGVS